MDRVRPDLLALLLALALVFDHSRAPVMPGNGLIEGRARYRVAADRFPDQETDELFVVPAWDYSFNVGGGNIISTAKDVARFGEALMQPGLLPAAELSLLMEFFAETDEGFTIPYPQFLRSIREKAQSH